MPRLMVALGGLVVVAAVGCTSTACQPKPPREVKVTEAAATAEAQLIATAETGDSSATTAGPSGFVLPAPTPTPAAPLTVDETLSVAPPTITAAPPSTLDPAATPHPNSTAILFLRDRSQSVRDLCGEKRFQTSLKQIPDFIYHFLAHAPHNPSVPLYVGLNEFPDNLDDPDGPNDWGTPYELRLIEPGDALDSAANDNWQEQLKEVWDEDFETSDKTNGVATAIDHALEQLNDDNIDAANKHLVIFGDGRLDYKGESEWDYFIGKDIDGLLLVDRLRNAGVHLHYVIYECLSYSYDIDSRWDKLHTQVDDDSEVWIELHSWADGTVDGSVADSRNDFKDHQNDDPDDLLPQPHLFNDLLHSLLGRLLPQTADGTTTPNVAYLLLPAGQNQDLKLPISGAVSGVEIKFLSLDTGLSFYFNASSEAEDTEPELLLNAVGKDLLPKPHCGGHTFYMSRQNRGALSLTYPALVWWAEAPLETGELTVTYANVQPSDGQLLAQGQTDDDSEVKLLVEWAGDPVHQECYRAEIVHVDAPLYEQNEARFADLVWPAEYHQPFNTPPIGLELALEVRLWRNDSLPRTGGQLGVTRWTFVGRQPLDPIAFRYAPTLAGDAFYDENAEEELAVYTVEIDFIDSEFYATADVRAAPQFKVMASEKSPGEPCQTVLHDGNEDLSTTLADWYYMELDPTSQEAEHLLAFPPSDPRSVEPVGGNDPGFRFHFNQSELDECGIEFLYIEWPGMNRPMFCSFAEERCGHGWPNRPTARATTTTE